MLFLLFKYSYKKLISGIENKVEEVKNTISSLEIRKKMAEEQIKKLKQELNEANESMGKAIVNAEEESRKIIEKSGETISSVIELKEKEYKETIEKVKSSLSAELQNKIVDLVIKSLVERLDKEHDNREFQNINIDNSIKMLDELVERRLSSKK